MLPGDQPIHHLLPWRVGFEVVQVCLRVGGLTLELVDWGGVQRLAEHLVGILMEPHHQWVRGHDGLHVVGLPQSGFAGHSYGVIDILDPTVGIEPDGFISLLGGGHERLLVQWISTGCHGVRGLVGVISVALALYEGVLIWVPVVETGSATPWSFHRWCTCRRNASHAAFTMFLLYMARVNCSSLHCKLIFFGDCAFSSSHVGRDLQYSFSFPKLVVELLGVGLVGWHSPHPMRV